MEFFRQKWLTRWLFSSSLLLAFSACGWHLRGQQDWPGTTQKIALHADSLYAPLTLMMREALHRQSLLADEKAELQLWLGNEQLSKRVVAVTRIGSPAQYQLTLTTHYKVYRLTHPTNPLIDPSNPLMHSISIEREFDFNPTSTVAKHAEETILMEEMRRALINRILARLPYLSPSKTPLIHPSTDASNHG